MVETSWLSALPEVRKVLDPLGFKRAEDGAYRLVLGKDQIENKLGVLRALTKALTVMLEERVYGREEEEEGES